MFKIPSGERKKELQAKCKELKEELNKLTFELALLNQILTEEGNVGSVVDLSKVFQSVKNTDDAAALQDAITALQLLLK